jgi:hypothetical protein
MLILDFGEVTLVTHIIVGTLVPYLRKNVFIMPFGDFMVTNVPIQLL